MVGSGGGSHFVAATAALPRQECLKKKKKKVVKAPRLLPTRLKSRKLRQSPGICHLKIEIFRKKN
jgi:hypothetical protein